LIDLIGQVGELRGVKRVYGNVETRIENLQLDEQNLLELIEHLSEDNEDV
jgi:hypothetical protein